MCSAVIDQAAPIIIDVEASGFGRGSYPIEIGFVLPDGNTHCTLIKPDPSWTHWDVSAEALHGISREILQKHGKPINDVAAWMNDHLRGTTAYSDAWCNDLSWLGLLFDFAELPQLFRLESLNTRLSEAQMNIWSDTRQQILVELAIKRHRASNDANVIQRTYLATLASTSNEPQSLWHDEVYRGKAV